MRDFVGMELRSPVQHEIGFVYYLVDPRDETVRYVGQSICPSARYQAHCLKRGGYVSDKEAWINELLSLGLWPILRVVSSHDFEGLDIAECHEIARLRDLGTPILNRTNGSGKRKSKTRSQDAVSARQLQPSS